jgi:hypothetical protein
MCIHLTTAFEFYHKKISNIFLVGYYISNYIKHIKKRFEETQNNDVFILPKRKIRHSGNELKIIHYVQTCLPDVKNLN